MRKCSVLILCSAICLFLCSCAKQANIVENTADSNLAEAEIEQPEDLEKEIYSKAKTLFKEGKLQEAEELFAQITEYSNASDYLKKIELLAPFQGEWKQQKSDWHMIIYGDTLVTAYYTSIDEEIEEGNYKTNTLDIGDNNEVFTSGSISSRHDYLTKISDTEIERSNDKNEIINIYEKVSDSTELPSVIHRSAPSIGMTQEEVIDSTWGSPKKRNKTTTAGGIREQWVYDKGYIYFENGYVTAIQE